MRQTPGRGKVVFDQIVSQQEGKREERARLPLSVVGHIVLLNELRDRT